MYLLYYTVLPPDRFLGIACKQKEFVNNYKTTTRGPFLMSFSYSANAKTYNKDSSGRTIGEFVGKTLMAS